MLDPDAEAVRLLGQPKNNLGRTDLPTLTFRINGVLVAHAPGGEPIWTGKLEWGGETDRSIGDAIQAATSGGDRTATSEAAEWLTDFLLTQPNHTAESAAIKAAGRKAGHSADTLKRARTKLGVGSDARGFPRRRPWALPVGADSRGNIDSPAAPTESRSAQSVQSVHGRKPPTGRNRAAVAMNFPTAVPASGATGLTALSRESGSGSLISVAQHGGMCG